MFAAKIKNFLLNLYPELSHLPLFKEITTTIIPSLTPRLRKSFRYGLPVITILFVLVVGTTIGTWFLAVFFPKEITPAPIQIVLPTVAPGYQSPFLSLKRSIEAYNPALPDPIPPVFDVHISLETIEQ